MSHLVGNPEYRFSNVAVHLCFCCSHRPASLRVRTFYVLSKKREKDHNFSSENNLFYSNEKSLNIAWACFCNVLSVLKESDWLWLSLHRLLLQIVKQNTLAYSLNEILVASFRNIPRNTMNSNWLSNDTINVMVKFVIPTLNLIGI